MKKNLKYQQYKENKVFYFIMAGIILVTLLLILFVHLFNTSKESVYPIENYMICE